MKFRSRVIAAAFAATSLASGLFAADNPKIERPVAEKTALTRVPGGQVKEAELEREHGRLVWSFDIATPDSKNITEVQVDAMTGEVVAVEMETPADQAKEAAQEKKDEKEKKQRK